MAQREKTDWEKRRNEWVRHCPAADLLNVIAQVTRNWNLDEHRGDWQERAETLLWLATRGTDGADWGGAAMAASRTRSWSDLWEQPA